MSAPPNAPGNLPEPPPLNEPRLESWGEIASYLNRDIRTVQRWEKDYGLPVRRLKIGSLGQVYAYRSELDKWRLQRQPRPEPNNGEENEDHKNETNVPSDPVNRAASDNSIEVMTPDRPQPTPAIWKLWLGAGVTLLVLLAAGSLLLHNFQSSSFLSTARQTDKAFLFVRPFTSVSEELQERQFVVGLTDDLITHLGRLDPDHLIVFAPTTSKELGNKSIEELHNAHKVNFVLEGSVRRDQNQLRIEAALISADDQKVKWTKAYTDALGSVLKFQDEVSEDVQKEIRLVIPNLANQPRRVDTLPVQPAVYEAYLKGRVFWLDRDIGRALNEYQQSLKVDPSYAPALAGLAATYVLMGESPNDVISASEAIPKARDAAKQAIAIDPSLADADWVLAHIAMVYDHDFPQAERLFKKAIAEDPSNVTAHEWYGYYLMITNQMPQAEIEMNQALQIDPASPLINSAVAEVRYFRRDYDGSIAQAKRTLELHPGFLYSVFWLGSSYREKKMYKEAIEQFGMASAVSKNNPAMLWAYGHALGVSGNKERANAVLQDLLAMKQSKYVPSLYIAGMYAGLGDKNQTFHWLDEAFKEKNDRIIYLAVDPLADPLRSDSRFPSLMRRCGLP